jgi:hypothetical protein
MAPLTASKSARRPYDARKRRASTKKRTSSRSAEMTLIHRALRAVARLDGDGATGEYAVTDVRRAASMHGTRGRDVVFLEQRLFGLPVYGGRRSVILDPRRARVTGTRIELRPPSRLTPAVTAEAAACKAVEIVTGRKRLGASKLISASPGAERTSVVEIEGLESPVTAYLTLFGRTIARLAWALTFSLPDGDGFKIVIDATSKRLLRRRQTVDHATACLAIDPGAGGPAAGQPQMQVTFNAAWIDPAGRNFECVSANGAALTLPGPNAAGNYCNAVAQPFQQTTLNSFAVANAGFDLIEQFGGILQARVKLTLLNSASTDVNKIALAKPDLVSPLLKFMARSPSLRHAASDPSVVLHELGHLVLSAGVGGSQASTPFEMTGESAAVNEGLADFLGLTLWNAIRRTPLGSADLTAFGDWVFGASGRNYTPFLNPGAAVPTFPGSGTPHNRGMVLCTALLRARRAIELAASATQADSIMLSTLCAALNLMPHQGDLPHFCCVSEAMRDVVPLAHLAKLEAAFNAAAIPNNCPHIV